MTSICLSPTFFQPAAYKRRIPKTSVDSIIHISVGIVKAAELPVKMGSADPDSEADAAGLVGAFVLSTSEKISDTIEVRSTEVVGVG